LARRPACEPSLCDLRFRALVGESSWSRLAPEVRRRFSRRLGPGEAVTYAGTILESRRSLLGMLLAQACRLIGAPLPLNADVDVGAVVAVTEDGASGGQVWTRIYARPRGVPQVIHSAKRFAGSTGLEEALGSAVGIALTVRAETGALRFVSDHYFLALGRWRLRLPDWLGPGRLEVSHIDRGDGSFLFVLELRHRMAGELIAQTCLFRERISPRGST
jgi:hypothetical protein